MSIFGLSVRFSRSDEIPAIINQTLDTPCFVFQQPFVPLSCSPLQHSQAPVDASTARTKQPKRLSKKKNLSLDQASTNPKDLEIRYLALASAACAECSFWALVDC